MKFIKTISDFFIWKKERKIKEFSIVRDIKEHYEAYFSNKKLLQSMNNGIGICNKLYFEYKEELKKDYSDKKYEIIDKLKKLYPLLSKQIDKYIESYYEIYDRDLISDIEDCLEYLEKSKWYYTNVKDMFLELKLLLSHSKISHSINSILDK